VELEWRRHKSLQYHGRAVVAESAAGGELEKRLLEKAENLRRLLRAQGADEAHHPFRSELVVADGLSLADPVGVDGENVARPQVTSPCSKVVPGQQPEDGAAHLEFDRLVAPHDRGREMPGVHVDQATRGGLEFAVEARGVAMATCSRCG
jgi:hypothetical protein